MSLSKTILAGLTGGLLIAQSTAAAALPARTSADIGHSDDIAGAPPGSGPIIGAILLVLLIFGIMALTEDDDGPISP